MPNAYYNFANDILAGGQARASQIAQNLQLITAAFNLLPAGVAGGFTDPVLVGAATLDGHAAQWGQVKTWSTDVTAAGFKLTNLGAPTSDNDAARKVYVDAADALRVLKAGLDGNLPAGGFKLTGLGAGSDPTDSINFGQVTAAVAAALATAVLKSGLTANLSAENNKITNIATASASGDVLGFGQATAMIAAAVGNYVLKSGLTANLSAGGYRITGAGDAVDAADYTTLSQVNAIALGGGSPAAIDILTLNGENVATGQLITGDGTVGGLSAVDQDTFEITGFGSTSMVEGTLLTSNGTTPVVLSPAEVHWLFGG